MKMLCTWLTGLTLFCISSFAQNVAINEDGSLPHPRAILDVKSGTKGILIPRMSTADRLAIAAPKGMLVFDTTTNSFWYSERLPDTGTTSIWTNLASGTNWKTSGNTADNNSYLGTFNREPLRIITYGRRSGLIHPVSGNSYWGYMAGYLNSDNYADSTAIKNTAIGSSSFFSNRNGQQNTAAGSYSMYSNQSGSSNVALGAYSFYNNITGDSNTATGSLSLYWNIAGVANTANGAMALYRNSRGLGNTACGTFSLVNNDTGSYNTAIGYSSLTNAQSGSYNTAIGTHANVAFNWLYNATAIGAGAIANASNKVRIGNSAVTSIEGQVPFMVPSDGRFKFGIKEDVKGLDFILQLRPVTYQFDVKRFDTQTGQPDNNNNQNNQNINAMTVAYKAATDIRRSGFIAQEVEKAAEKSDYNFSGIKKPNSPEEHYSLSYESFVVPLVKAVQELHEQMQDLRKKNEYLERENEKIKQLLNTISTSNLKTDNQPK